MGYVQSYGKDKYRARARVAGRLTSKSFDSRAEAWAWVEAAESDSPHKPVRPSHIPTVGAFLESGGYVTAHMRPTTKNFATSIINAHVRPQWESTRLDEITHRDLQRWILDDVDPKLAPSTRKHIAGVMSRILASAVKSGYIQSNPATGLVLPSIQREEMRFLDPNEIDRLAATIDARFAALVYLGAYGGLRIGELLGLRADHIDPARGRVDVADCITDNAGRATVGPPKTRAGRRTVALPRSVVRIALAHSESSCGARRGRAWLFPASTGGPMLPTNFRRNIWRPAVARAGMTGLRVHDLRHTAVALWIAAGASPKEVASRAGHTSVSFSLDRYGHLFPAQEDRLVSRLERIYQTKQV